MSGQQPRVFICEDDFLLADALSDAVMQLGCAVVACEGHIGRAIEAAKTADCQFAIVDLDLRGIMTYDVLDALNQRGIPFIMATGAAEDDIPMRYAHAPRVIKPYALHSLRQAMTGLGVIESG